MKNTDLVSVVIPAYRVEKYIQRCLDSVIAQTYKNIQIILVDDGSPDKSGQIADKYALIDDRINVIHKENGGVSSARNAGIDAATGKYICFIDGDDWVEIDYVEYMFTIAENVGADITVAPEYFSLLHKSQTKYDKIEKYSPEKAIAEILYSNIPVGCYSRLYSLKLLNQHMLRFLPEFCMGEGFNFNVSAFQKAKVIAVGHKKIYNYRLDNNDSVTTKFNMVKWENGLEAILNIKRNLTINTETTEDAWNFAWWLTNYDIVRLIIGSSVQKQYAKEFKRCLNVVRKESPKMSNINGSLGRKGRILIIKTNAILAAKIDNSRRNRAMRNAISIDGAIVSITTNNNYGNVIQRWALQKFLSKNGYNFISYYFYGYYVRQYLPRQSRLFAPLRIAAYTIMGRRKDLRPSSSFYNYRMLSKFCMKRINQELYMLGFRKKYKTYIVGSDQVFNYKIISSEFLTSWKNFMLNFVNWSAKRIAYAPSFGSEKSIMPDNAIASIKAKDLANKFDAISSREESGVKAISKLWGMQAKEVVDPTLLLEVADYQELIQNPVCTLKKVEPIFYYILRDDANDTQKSFAMTIAKQIGKKSSGISGYNRQDLPAVEQWLKGFADADFIITDSFHGTVFSLINHKEFIVICSAKANKGGGFVRQSNLLNKLNLSERIVHEKDFESFNVNSLSPINWKKIDIKLVSFRDESANWLLKQLRSK